MEIFNDAKSIKSEMNKKIMESCEGNVSITFKIAEKNFTKITEPLKDEYSIIAEKLDNEFFNLDVEWKRN